MSAPPAPSRPDRALALACAVFFASGFAALLYQVIWQRLLALFSGADVFSVTLIVAAFMGGLGLGNLAGGHLADRLSRAGCFACFAAAELAIAAFAIGSRAFYYDGLYAHAGALDRGGGALAALLFASVLWPTFLMGLSLPLLARGLARSLGEAARVVGSLYGWNTFGAAAGAFATPWLLMRRFDFETSLWIGAALNLGCAAAAGLLHRRLGRAHAAVAPEAEGPGHPAAPGFGDPRTFGLAGWMGLFFFSGAIALSLEIAWFRALGVMLKSTSFTFGTLLGFYLLGNAIGALVGAWLVSRSRRSPTSGFLAAQTGVALWAALSLLLLVGWLDPERTPRLWSYFARSDQLPVATILVVLENLGATALLSPITDNQRLARLFVLLHALLPLVLIGPATLLMGLSFPFLQRAVQTDARALGRRVGWLQSANIAGSLAGSLVTGFVLLPRLGTPGTFRAIAVAALCFPLLAVAARRGSAPLAPAFGAAALAVAAWAMPSSARFWAPLHGTEAGQVVVAEDASGVSLSRPGVGEDESLVMAGGIEVSAIPYGSYGATHSLLGAIPVLIHPSPERVAVIGIGSGDTAYAAAARAETREVVAIEIIGSQLDVLRTLAGRAQGDAGLRAFLDDPRIRRVVADGRTWLRRDPGRFDVIEADALRATSAYSGNLYSREYFELLRERLAPGGLAVSWLPTARVADTLATVFPYAIQLGNIGIASAAPIPFDPEAVARAANTDAVRRHLSVTRVPIPERIVEFVRLTPPRVLANGAPRAGIVDLNSDLFPRDEFVVAPFRPIQQRAGR